MKVVERCRIGKGTVIRDFVNLFGCTVGEDCRIAAFVEIQEGVVVGDRCKIEPFAFLPRGVRLGNEVFVGPHVVFTNDKHPRATGAWEVTPTIVEDGASIGAGAVVVCGVTIGRGAMVGAGAVVTRDVPPDALVLGSPARVVGQAPKLRGSGRATRPTSPGRSARIPASGDSPRRSPRRRGGRSGSG